MLKRNLIVTVVISLALMLTTNAFSQPGKKNSSAETPTRIAKSKYLSQENVSKSVNVNFDKKLKDATGNMHRIQIKKVERLKTGGFRYYAKVDGEARNISYLLIEKNKIALINVDGNNPEHNLYMAIYPLKNSVMTELWTGNRLLSEIPEFWEKETDFSMVEKYVDERSFALLVAAPNQITGLKPGELFDNGKQTSVNANSNMFDLHSLGNTIVKSNAPVASNQIKDMRLNYLFDFRNQSLLSGGSSMFNPPDFNFGNIFNGAIKVGCRLTQKTTKQCSGGCAPVNEGQVEGAWGLFGGKRAECQDAGCQMCAGICCQPNNCTSVQEQVLDCSGSGSN